MKKPGKKAGILGLGTSGYQSALFLAERGFDVWVSEAVDTSAVRGYAAGLKDKNIPFEIGGHSIEKISQVDWVMISPGIPPHAEIYKDLCKIKMPLYSEIEVASWFCPSKKIVAVTGTSGKTTVTTLVTRVLQQAGFQALCAGNIGNPWIGEIPRIRPADIVVLEISSFQLENCESFRPWIGALLNLSPNHLDWHRGMSDYTDAKLKMFKNQSAGDYALFRREDQRNYFPGFKFRAQTAHFGENTDLNPNEEVIRLITGLLGCSGDHADDVLSRFEGIEHRLEKFMTLEGVTYINDSKCTTVASLAWALEKFPDGRVILIAGGHPKSSDFHTITRLIRRKVRGAVLIGEAKALLREAWQESCPVREASHFEEAIQWAGDWASAGDIVLLSPACASFDMFKNYIERGQTFKKRVRERAASVDV